MRFVGMNHLDAPRCQQAPQQQRRLESSRARPHGVNGDAFGLRALGQRASTDSYQFRRISTGTHPAKRQQRLALAAPPLALEINEENGQRLSVASPAPPRV